LGEHVYDFDVPATPFPFFFFPADRLQRLNVLPVNADAWKNGNEESSSNRAEAVQSDLSIPFSSFLSFFPFPPFMGNTYVQRPRRVGKW